MYRPLNAILKNVNTSVSSPNILRQISIFACCISIWLISHPYRGLFHGACFYAVQALYRIDRGAFQNDLFFRYGSQDSFSVFSALYAPLITHLGLGSALALVTFCGEALWFFAALQLIRTLSAHDTQRVALFFGAILLCRNYGGLHTFHYAENFGTPRLYAEALVILALNEICKNAWVRSGGFLAIAALFHPIMALTGIAIVGVVAAFEIPILFLWVPFASQVGCFWATLVCHRFNVYFSPTTQNGFTGYVL